MWRFSMLHLRPVAVAPPGARRTSCAAATLVPNQVDDHIAEIVAPRFDYDDSVESSATAIPPHEDDLQSLTAELQDLMSELQQVPTAQWQPTPDGNFVLSVSGPAPAAAAGQPALVDGLRRHVRMVRQRPRPLGGAGDDRPPGLRERTRSAAPDRRKELT